MDLDDQLNPIKTLVSADEATKLQWLSAQDLNQSRLREDKSWFDELKNKTIIRTDGFLNAILSKLELLEDPPSLTLFPLKVGDKVVLEGEQTVLSAWIKKDKPAMAVRFGSGNLDLGSILAKWAQPVTTGFAGKVDTGNSELKSGIAADNGLIICY
jgi:hypothetical protein